MSWIEKIAEARRKNIKIEFTLLILVLLVVSVFISRPEVIGYASTNIHSQPINIKVDQSKSFYLESDVPVHLTSMSLSGKIIGSGTVAVYLSNTLGARVLIFENTKKASSRINQITGNMPTAGGFYMFSRMSGSSVTGDALPAKESPPALRLLEGERLSGFEPLKQGYLTIAGVFNYACMNSCILREDDFTGNRFKLDFYIQPGTQVDITEMMYTTYEVE